MNAKLKSKWWVDAGLFIIFLAAFFLNLTGLSLHQWIGVAAGAIALYHLITHWAWVKSVTARLFDKAASRSKRYYLIDAGLMLGLFTIIGTGLVISTWLNLSLTFYAAWRFVHIAASILTLGLTVAKISLHWRWIVTVARNIFSQPVSQPTRTAAGQQALPAKMVSRREFGQLLAVVGIGSFFALSRGIKSLQADETTGAAAENTTQSSTIDLTSLFTSAQSDPSTATTCAIRCNRKCSYPGHCGRYTDSNGNSRCDLGECA
jgi:hypothetical protein